MLNWFRRRLLHKQPKLSFTAPDDNVGKFLSHVMSELCDEDFKLNICFAKEIKDGSGNGFAGQFDDVEKEIDIAICSDRWLPTLVHEFAHFRQWRDGTPAWEACYDEDGNDLSDIWDWVNGDEELPKDVSDHMCDLARNMEHEAEIMTVNMIRQFDLPVDLKEYEQNAVLYVMFYNYIKKNRKWCKKSIYDDVPSDVRKNLPSLMMGWRWQFMRLEPDLEKFYDSTV